MALPPITDLPSLYANASDYLVRADLEQYYPTFLGLAEARLESVLKTPGMENEIIIDADSTNAYPVPDSYIDWISARWFSSDNKFSQSLINKEANSPEFTIRYRPNGNPQYYALLAGRIRLRPERAGKLVLAYYQRIPHLTDAAPVNWLITKAPQLYLAAFLAEAYAFQKDEARTLEWITAMEKRLADFVAEASGNKVGLRATRGAEIEAEVVAAKALN